MSVIAMSLLWIQGCAVHYFDSKTGTEHIWGFGHMKMKATVPNEGVKSVVRGNELLGVSAGWVDRRPSMIVGWEKQQQLEIIAPDTAIRLEWPSGDFFNVRIGTNFPTELISSAPNRTTREREEPAP